MKVTLSVDMGLGTRPLGLFTWISPSRAGMGFCRIILINVINVLPSQCVPNLRR
jgi:hypothetical protein